jgi:quercetin dioxygenase-like cupin family protein
MTVSDIRKQLETSSHPIAKSFHVGDKFKVLLFGFKKGMKLEDHTAKHPTKLLVLEGDLIYHKEKKDIRLKKFDEVEIPANVPHSLGALKDSMLLLTQG